MAKPTGRGGIDSPDFIQGVTPHENPVEITLAELAIRLGYPHVFERTGNLLYQENFEYGIGEWELGCDAGGELPILSSHGLMGSPYSAKIRMQGGATSQGSMTKRIAYPYITTYGVEIAFLPTDSFGSIYFGIVVRTGAYQYTIYARWDDVGETWGIFVQGQTWVEVASYNLGAGDNQVWHPVKVVFDIVNQRYARLMYDAIDIDLAEYAIEGAASGEAPGMAIIVVAFQDGARTGDVYVDNLLVTINEPT